MARRKMDRIIDHVKAASIAVGVIAITTNGRKRAFDMLGSGFFVTPSGLIMTAGHVIRDCINRKQQYEAQDAKTKIVGLRVTTSEHGYNFSWFQVAHTGVSKIVTGDIRGNLGTDDYDIGLASLEKKYENLPFLQSSKEPSPVGSEIAVCGYPATDITMEILNSGKGIRMSPILQFGRVAGYMPNDHLNNNYGIQTDIVSMGGVSGAPILSMNNGDVVGLAQKILPTLVIRKSDLKPLKQYAHIGLLFGLSNAILRPTLKDIIAQYTATGKLPTRIKTKVLGIARQNVTSLKDLGLD